jgi:hypothetical protein
VVYTTASLFVVDVLHCAFMSRSRYPDHAHCNPPPPKPTPPFIHLLSCAAVPAAEVRLMSSYTHQLCPPFQGSLHSAPPPFSKNTPLPPTRCQLLL